MDHLKAQSEANESERRIAAEKAEPIALIRKGATTIFSSGKNPQPRAGDRLKVEMRVIGADANAPLGIDACGGTQVRLIADALSDGATVVNYGYLSGAPCEIEPGHLIVRGQTLTGFWLAGWMGSASREAKEALFAPRHEPWVVAVIQVPEMMVGVDKR